MIYGGINFIAVFVATVAGMASGAVWYGLFKEQWRAANGLVEADIRGADDARYGGASRYLIAGLAKLVMAFCLAKLMEVLDAISVGNGIALALFLWIGFIATSLSVNHRFQLKPWTLTAIDGGYWLLVMLLQAVIIGFFG